MGTLKSTLERVIRIEKLPKILCAHLIFESQVGKSNYTLTLKQGYSEKQYQEFINKLSFDPTDYEHSCYVYGAIYLEEEMRLECEFDEYGIEWKLIKPFKIPKECLS